MSKATCAHPACERDSRAVGLCANHYQQKLYAERRTAQSRQYRVGYPDLEERFHSKYVRGADSQCWEWRGARREFGHGIITRNGRVEVASRIALELATGEPAPDGMLACHRCDNPPCVNPKHLYWGTRQDNANDAVARSRYALGSDRPQARLIESNVADIKRRRAAGETIAELSREFGVSQPTIRSITTGKKWKHVAGPITPSRSN